MQKEPSHSLQVAWVLTSHHNLSLVLPPPPPNVRIHNHCPCEAKDWKKVQRIISATDFKHHIIICSQDWCWAVNRRSQEPNQSRLWGRFSGPHASPILKEPPSKNWYTIQCHKTHPLGPYQFFHQALFDSPFENLRLSCPISDDYPTLIPSFLPFLPLGHC